MSVEYERLVHGTQCKEIFHNFFSPAVGRVFKFFFEFFLLFSFNFAIQYYLFYLFVHYLHIVVHTNIAHLTRTQHIRTYVVQKIGIGCIKRFVQMLRRCCWVVVNEVAFMLQTGGCVTSRGLLLFLSETFLVAFSVNAGPVSRRQDWSRRIQAIWAIVQSAHYNTHCQPSTF